MLRHKSDKKKNTHKNTSKNVFSNGEEGLSSTVPIKEAISEDEDPEEEKIDTSTGRKRTSSEIIDTSSM